MDVKKVTFSPILLPLAEEESSEFFIFIRKNVLAILANFIPEESVNFGSFFLEVMEQVPDSSPMAEKKFQKNPRVEFSPRKNDKFGKAPSIFPKPGQKPQGFLCCS